MSIALSALLALSAGLPAAPSAAAIPPSIDNPTDARRMLADLVAYQSVAGHRDLAAIADPARRRAPAAARRVIMFAKHNIVTHRPPVRPPNGTRTEEKPHPSLGGNVYPPKMRDQVISLWENGADLQNSPWLADLREQKKFSCWRTCQRWIELFNSEGHTLRKRATGNRISEREVNGQDIVNLAIYRMVCPKAYIKEVRAYVHNMNPDNPPYSHSQIGRVENRLRLHQKVGSMTSDCAYFEINLFKRERYWHNHYPDC